MHQSTVKLACCMCLLAPVMYPHPAWAIEPAPITSSGFYLPEPISLQPFSLVDQDGKPFDRSRLLGRWSLLVFGYTHCPDVCPTTLAKMQDVRKLANAQAPEARLNLILVTVDPQRDTPQHLSQYVAAFGGGLIGLSGSTQDIEKLARQFEVKYSVSDRAAKDYLLDHTSTVALVTPRAELRALFSVPLRPGQVASDVRRIMKSDSERLARQAMASTQDVLK